MALFLDPTAAANAAAQAAAQMSAAGGAVAQAVAAQVAAATAPFRILVTQTAGPARTTQHAVTKPVVSPLMTGNRLVETSVKAELREFLFKVEKFGKVWWVGAAVPAGTTTFTRAQVYFHPTVVNGHSVHARDQDYPTFTGGWSGSLQRYVELQGTQLAAARPTVLLVPFTTMTALAGGNSLSQANLFADRPAETLNAVMAAVQREVAPNTAPVALERVGLASFSSGITALRQAVKALQPSGLVKEVTDFDSPFIVAEPNTLVAAPGAVSRCSTQTPPAHKNPKNVFLSPDKFANLSTFKDKGVHSQIGWMMFYSAMLASVL